MMLRNRNKPIAHIEKLLSREDRVASWAVAGDDVVVATRFGLWWPDKDAPRLISWPLIDKATWDDGRLTVIEAEVVDELLLVDRPAVSITLTEPRDLPPTIRKRVELSVAQSELVALPGGAGRFVGRRVPGQDGLTWWCRLEPGTPDNVITRDAVESIITAFRARTNVTL